MHYLIQRTLLAGLAWFAPGLLRAQDSAPNEVGTLRLAIAPLAAADRSKEDYADSASATVSQAAATLKINPAEVNIVAGNLGQFGPDFEAAFINHMNLWLRVKTAGSKHVEWKLQVPAEGVYEVAAVVLGQGSRLMVTCNGQKLETPVEGKTWERVKLGQVRLKPGENVLQLEVEATADFKLDALELVQPLVKANLLKEALAMRQRADWFSDAGYGLMFQWTNRATPPKGPVKPWEAKVNDFDLPAFVDMVESSGAAYVLWSVTWGQQYISAPLASLDQIIKGRTTKRDLLGEMADALQAKGIKVIFYYHYGYDCGHSIDADWMNASGGYKADKTEFYRNWMEILSEIGTRYGDKLNGWWFDGGQRYYNCHFDGTPGDQGILSAPFKELTLAARSGNAARIVAYNSWIKPRQTEYQDYYAGEGAHLLKELHEGIATSGPQEGLMGHGCFTFEKEWGHIKPDTVIPKPKFTLEKLTSMVRIALKERSPLSINLEMYEDGSVSPESIALLGQLRKEIRGQ